MQQTICHKDTCGIQEGTTNTERERFFWFTGIGAVSSLVDIGLLHVFCEWFAVWYLAAAVFSFCCGILVSYTLNKILTFHDHSRHHVRQFSTFAIISVSCLMVNVGIIWLLVTLLSWNYLVAKVLATFCSVFWSYYGQSRITFRAVRE